MSSPASSADRPELVEQLTAYLDGELDAGQAAEVESLLAADPQARLQLRQLERAWDLLDRLPRAEVESSFTQSTVEMIALAESEQLAGRQARQPGRQRKALLVSAACVLLSAVAGYVAFDRLWPGANEQLLRDLPVVEHLDAYRQADSIEFLRMLRDEGLFVEGDDDGS